MSLGHNIPPCEFEIRLNHKAIQAEMRKNIHEFSPKNWRILFQNSDHLQFLHFWDKNIGFRTVCTDKQSQSWEAAV